MDASYFRALAVRCTAIAQNCFDKRAADELRRLANEFAIKADELERTAPPVEITRPESRASENEEDK